jgi:hypothetical protein
MTEDAIDPDAPGWRECRRCGEWYHVGAIYKHGCETTALERLDDLMIDDILATPIEELEAELSATQSGTSGENISRVPKPFKAEIIK